VTWQPKLNNMVRKDCFTYVFGVFHLSWGSEVSEASHLNILLFRMVAERARISLVHSYFGSRSSKGFRRNLAKMMFVKVPIFVQSYCLNFMTCLACSFGICWVFFRCANRGSKVVFFLGVILARTWVSELLFVALMPVLWVGMLAMVSGGKLGVMQVGFGRRNARRAVRNMEQRRKKLMQMPSEMRSLIDELISYVRMYGQFMLLLCCAVIVKATIEILMIAIMKWAFSVA
jgi:hypothetical protein